MPERRGERADREHRQPHLEAAAHDRLAPHLAQPAEREFDADREQQQDHPDFGEAFHAVDVGHEPERVRAHEDPGDDESGERGDPEAVEGQDHDHGDREDDREIFENEELFHRHRLPF